MSIFFELGPVENVGWSQVKGYSPIFSYQFPIFTTLAPPCKVVFSKTKFLLRLLFACLNSFPVTVHSDHPDPMVFQLSFVDCCSFFCCETCFLFVFLKIVYFMCFVVKYVILQYLNVVFHWTFLYMCIGSLSLKCHLSFPDHGRNLFCRFSARIYINNTIFYCTIIRILRKTISYCVYIYVKPLTSDPLYGMAMADLALCAGQELLALSAALLHHVAERVKLRFFGPTKVRRRIQLFTLLELRKLKSLGKLGQLERLARLLADAQHVDDQLDGLVEFSGTSESIGQLEEVLNLLQPAFEHFPWSQMGSAPDFSLTLMCASAARILCRVDAQDSECRQVILRPVESTTRL